MPTDPRPGRRLFAITFLLLGALHLPSPGWLLLLDLLLLSAFWILAARCFASPLTVFFVAVAATGSPLVLEQAPALADTPARLLDFLLGLTPAPYCGLFTLSFAALAVVLSPPRPRAAILAAAAVLAATLLLEGAVLPWLRLGVIFLAGRGLEVTLASGVREPRLMTRTGAALLTLAGLLAFFGAEAGRLITDPVPERLIGMACLGAVTTSGVFLLLGHARRTIPLGLALLFFLHPLDLFSWKYRMTWQHSSPGDAARAAP